MQNLLVKFFKVIFLAMFRILHSAVSRIVHIYAVMHDKVANTLNVRLDSSKGFWMKNIPS